MGSSLREALLPSRAFRRQPPGVMGSWQLRSHRASIIASGREIVGAETELGTPMFVDEAWRPPGEPPPPEPRPTERQERVFLWLIAVNALLLLIAPMAGATIIHAALAALRHG